MAAYNRDKPMEKENKEISLRARFDAVQCDGILSPEQKSRTITKFLGNPTELLKPQAFKVFSKIVANLQEKNTDECFEQHHAHIVNNLREGEHYDLARNKKGVKIGRVCKRIHELPVMIQGLLSRLMRIFEVRGDFGVI